ncbi:hypothetical protein QJQ45_014569 [Haematococcus lacustris]|nr:hypothetical protein QJQ45_014569 [Haematococcus lacustris]
MQDERKRSVLDTLGEEVTGIVAPVSLCMLITVILVRILNPDGSSSASGSSIIIASVAYNENPNDSASTKFSGALLNAVIFAGIMAAMTFVLVALFYYKCYKIIYGYMTFAVFDIFFLITGVVALQVLQAWNIHVDVFSFLFSLLNFSVCGTLGLLFMPMPLLAKQGYNIWTGVVTAYIFTWIPEWTSWLLICIMALYDIAAVLIPGGPLNLLVRLSQERQQGLPALVYEARPTHGRYQPDVWARRGQPVQEATQQLPLPHEASQQLPSHTPLPPGADDVVGPSSLAPPLHPTWPAEAGQVPKPGGAGHSFSSPASSASPAAAAASPRHSNASTSSSHTSRLRMRQPPTPLLGAATASSTVVPLGSPAPGWGVGETGGQGQGQAGGSQGASRSRQELADARGFGGGLVGGEGGGGPASLPGPQGRGVPGGWTPPGPGQVQGGGGPVGEGVEDPLAAGTQGWAPLPGGPSAGGSAAAPQLSPGSGSGRLAAGVGGSGGGPLLLPPPPVLGVPVSAPGVQEQQGLVGGVAVGGAAPGLMVAPVGQHPASGEAQQQQPGQQQRQQQQQGEEEFEMDIPDSIKLGLGDFIFYSMLVGRAAMYDYMTVFSSYLGIIAGLGITLLCLTFYQKALPALPFSIALGVAFYFLTRLVLEPFLVPLASSLTYF